MPRPYTPMIPHHLLPPSDPSDWSDWSDWSDKSDKSDAIPYKALISSSIALNLPI